MKTTFITKLSTLLFFAFFLNAKIVQSQVQCSFAVVNNGACTISGTVTYYDCSSTPATPCNGPISFSIPGGQKIFSCGTSCPNLCDVEVTIDAIDTATGLNITVNGSATNASGSYSPTCGGSGPGTYNVLWTPSSVSVSY